MRHKTILSIILVLGLLAGSVTLPVTAGDNVSTHPQQAVPDAPIAFELISEGIGWVATGGQLLKTIDNGATWQDVTPEAANGMSMMTAAFVDPANGFSLWIDGEMESQDLALFATQDGGTTWQTLEGLQAAASQAAMPFSGSGRMQWLDGQQGWLQLKYATSSNFSLGLMLRTSDGGANFEILDAPFMEEFVFANAEVGFLMGFGLETGLYQTLNGGKSWQYLDVSAFGLPEGRVGLPVFSPDGSGVLTIEVQTEAEQPHSVVLASADLGQTWQEATVQERRELINGDHAQALPASADEIALWPKVIDAAQVSDGALLESMGSAHDVHKLSASGSSAWAEIGTSICQFVNPADPGQGKWCQSERMLVKSSDGGQSWQVMNLPQSSDRPSITISQPEVLDAIPQEAVPFGAVITMGQGFDSCAVPTVDQMQKWMASGPYQTYGLYIGGMAAYCPSKFTAPQIRVLRGQGWKFIPTWVGPQAPCSYFDKRFSADPKVAYAEGVDNANQAYEALKKYGLLGPDGRNSVVYYDLEYFRTYDECKTAVQQFVIGWTKRLAELGVTSGLYGTSTNIRANEFASLSPALKAVWIAEWFYVPGYRPNADVFKDVDYLPDEYWNNHQRLFQYSGGHYETYAGITFNIDSNALDGPVAVPPGSDFVPPVSVATVTGTKPTDPWYKAPVTVTITAKDDASGIKSIRYRINGGLWQTYSTPLVVKTHGTTVIDYHAIDGLNNWELPKSVRFSIDAKAPENPYVNMTACVGGNFLPNACQDPAFTWKASTDAESGMPANPYLMYWGPDPAGTSTTRTGVLSFDPPLVTGDPVTRYLRFSTVDNYGNASPWQTRHTFVYNSKLQPVMWMPAVGK